MKNGKIEKIEKIKKIEKCLNCGFCCTKAPCDLALYELDKKIKQWTSPCCFLMWEFVSGRNLCKLIINNPENAERLHVGAGCCMNLNTWRFDIVDRSRYLRIRDMVE